MNSPVTYNIAFRSGAPMEMRDWFHLDTTQVQRKKLVWGWLFSECLRIYENSACHKLIHAIDLFDAAITCSWKTVFIDNGETSYRCIFTGTHEARSWADALVYASKRSFRTSYILGASFARSSTSGVHYAVPRREAQQTFAVKITARKPKHEIAFRRIQREQHLNSCLSHPNLVPTVDVFSTSEVDYIVMKFMPGGTLKSYLRMYHHLSETDAKHVFLHIARGLHYIHSKNIVHRDICSDKIFFSARTFPMEVAIGDFGNANFCSPLRINDNVFEGMVGSPSYMSTEMIRGARYGTAVDLWSLGVVLYEMLCGELPFQGSSTRAIIAAISTGIVIWRNAIWESISSSAKGLVLQLLQPNPKRRIGALACLHHCWLNPIQKFPTIHKRLKRTEDIECRSELQSAAFLLKTGRGMLTRLQGEKKCAEFYSVLEQEPASSFRSGFASEGYHRSLQTLPSVRAIGIRGFRPVAKDIPARFEMLITSPMIQKHLMLRFSYRRKLVVVSRAFIFVSRLQSISRNVCFTLQLPRDSRTVSSIEQIGKIRKLYQEHFQDQRKT